MGNRLAIVVGHNSVSQGAVRSDTGETEYVYNSAMADFMKSVEDQYGLDIRIFKRQPGYNSYTREIHEVYKETDKWGADATIELHFNSAGDPRASGTETLSSGSRKSVILAEEVQMELVEELGLKNRGVKIRNSRMKDRGWRSLVSGNAPAILTEPFFASSNVGKSVSDSKRDRERIAHAILEGAGKALDKF